jgi:hypothetical protein
MLRMVVPFITQYMRTTRVTMAMTTTPTFCAPLISSAVGLHPSSGLESNAYLSNTNYFNSSIAT